MTINLSVPQKEPELKPRITVIGVGGAGCNAVNNMIRAKLEGAEFISANTDAQSLHLSGAGRKIQLGATITQGLGAGSRPDIGRAAAEEAIDAISEHLAGTHMLFVTAGMGGGTGTGAAPVIARVARERGVLTVGVVTKPFHFEGSNRMRLAEAGLEEMQQYVDTLIVIPNQNLFRLATEKTTFAAAFAMADNVLYSGVRGITDLMVMPGLINLDFADIRAVMGEMGKAMMGTGEGQGDKRAIDAAEAAISNPLLDDVSMKGARGVLINITGGPDMTLYEVDEAANRIREEVDPDANIIFGSTLDESLEGQIRVSVVATGIDIAAGQMPRPQMQPAPRQGWRVLTGGSQTQPEATEAPVVSAPPAAAQPVAANDAPGAAPRAAPATAEAVAAQVPNIEPSGGAEAPNPAVAASIEPVVQPAASAPQSIGPNVAEVPTETDAFIPPIPVSVMPTPAPVPAATLATKPDPMGEADLVNASGPKKRSRGFFDWMSRELNRDSGPRAVKPPVPSREAQKLARGETPGADGRRRMEPGLGLRLEPKAGKPRGGAPDQSAPLQPTLGPLDPSERIQQHRDDDELLEIPTFLRRQAN